MHTGEQYHQAILSTQRDRKVRDKFQKMALALLPTDAEVLDFGAGTGIDAKMYAANGHRTFVYEPAQAMRDYLKQHCRDEIERETVITANWPLGHKVHAITANFAVLNHFESHIALFKDFARAVDRNGFVLVSMLNPYYLGDARYGWWRSNFVRLMRRGQYPIPSESGICRFAPRVVAQAAAPHFRLERLVPNRFGLLMEAFMFLLFRRA